MSGAGGWGLVAQVPRGPCFFRGAGNLREQPPPDPRMGSKGCSPWGRRGEKTRATKSPSRVWGSVTRHNRLTRHSPPVWNPGTSGDDHWLFSHVATSGAKPPPQRVRQDERRRRPGAAQPGREQLREEPRHRGEHQRGQHEAEGVRTGDDERVAVLRQAYTGTAHTTQPAAPLSTIGRRPIRSASRATGRVIAIPADAPTLAASSIVFCRASCSGGYRATSARRTGCGRLSGRTRRSHRSPRPCRAAAGRGTAAR